MGELFFSNSEGRPNVNVPPRILGFFAKLTVTEVLLSRLRSALGKEATCFFPLAPDVTRRSESEDDLVCLPSAIKSPGGGRTGKRNEMNIDKKK